MVVLGRVERAGCRGQDLGGDLAVAGVREDLLVGGPGRLGSGLLGVGVGVDRRAVLGADVVALAEALGGVVRLPEHLEQVRVRDLGGVVHDPHRLGVAGHAGAHLLVRRVRRGAALVADERRPDALGLPEAALGAPEAAEREVGDLGALRVGALEGGAQHGVPLRDGERQLVPAGEGFLAGREARLEGMQHGYRSSSAHCRAMAMAR